jgi:hypothetical protein
MKTYINCQQLAYNEKQFLCVFGTKCIKLTHYGEDVLSARQSVLKGLIIKIRSNVILYVSLYFMFRLIIIHTVASLIGLQVRVNYYMVIYKTYMLHFKFC